MRTIKIILTRMFLNTIAQHLKIYGNIWWMGLFINILICLWLSSLQSWSLLLLLLSSISNQPPTSGSGSGSTFSRKFSTMSFVSRSSTTKRKGKQKSQRQRQERSYTTSAEKNSTLEKFLSSLSNSRIECKLPQAQTS